MPGFVNWPGQLEQGSLEMPLHIVDWLPTLCHVAGYEGNLEELNLDGRNIWPFLTGEQAVPKTRTMYWKTDNAYAVREGPWKMLVHRNSDKTELFDLEDDFRETSDLSEEHPEKVEHLMKLLEKFKENDR